MRRIVRQSGAGTESDDDHVHSGRATMTWLGGGEAERDSGPDRTWLLESELAPGRPVKSKRSLRKPRGRFSTTRIELRHLLAVTALAGLFFAVVRSWLVLDFIGLLIWPVLLGFGIDRLCAGEG